MLLMAGSPGGDRIFVIISKKVTADVADSKFTIDFDGALAIPPPRRRVGLFCNISNLGRNATSDIEDLKIRHIFVRGQAGCLDDVVYVHEVSGLCAIFKYGDRSVIPNPSGKNR